ncbi:MAG: hypothetical protein R6U03_13080, partial [Gillisia sp.]
MKDHKMPLKELPFAGAINVLAHGENAEDIVSGNNHPWKGWRHFLRSLKNGYYQPLTKRIKEEFLMEFYL